MAGDALCKMNPVPTMLQTLLLCVLAPVCCSIVQERTLNYTCTQETGMSISIAQELGEEQVCETSLSNNASITALYSKNVSECDPPCLNISSGKIFVDGCCNLTLTEVCRVKDAFTERTSRYIVLYAAQPGTEHSCATAEPPRSHVSPVYKGAWASCALLLVGLISVFVFILRRRRRSTSAGI